jgi:hypothetical protein
VSILGGKPFMAPGADPFAALRLKREREAQSIPICDERWKSRSKDFDVECLHKCGRVHGHRAVHVCACGARKDLERNRRRKR